VIRQEGSVNDNRRLIASKLQQALGQLLHLPRALSLVWAAAWQWTAVWGVLLIMQGVLPVATVTLTRLLVDQLVAVTGGGGTWQSIFPALQAAALMGGAMLLSELLRGAASYCRTAQSELVQDHVTALIHKESTEVDLAFYDSPEYYDHLQRARMGGGYESVALLESIGALLQSGITLVAMGAVLMSYGAWLPLALLVSTLPAFYLLVHHNVRQHKWQLRTTPDRRRTWYYYWLLTAREAAAEMRLFRLGDHFQAAYQALRRRLRKERLYLARDQALGQVMAGTVALLVAGSTMAWMVWRALQGLATLGDLALFYQAFNQGQGLMRSLLGSVGQIYSNTLFLGSLFEFLALQPQVVDSTHTHPAPASIKGEIRFRGVSFRYPDSDRPAVQHLNLTVAAGQIAAIVGPNGAGKTTLIKLLCRFYDPEAGCIELDGVDLRQLPIAELRRLITVLFQEPVRYDATVSENIALGDLQAETTPREIEAAAQAAGAGQLVASLPLDYDTPLGKRFAGGTDLSVGEWQRIAMARAFLRQAPILILDEPTGNMDPWAEAEWVVRFPSVAAGRTAIVMTHRLTTALVADIIHVMHEGRIVESGTHHELLRFGGRYAQSWTVQTERTAAE
jgi:ATP-binding cassette subfamily B protein